MLKKVPQESGKAEGRVKVVQERKGWRTPENTWMEMKWRTRKRRCSL
jgi:hypothetical protein